jgi:hypothetical protein
MCRKYGLDACFAVEKDRRSAAQQISTEKGQYQRVDEAEIPVDGLRTHLKAFDWVTLFRTETKGQKRHYVYYIVFLLGL